MALTTNLIGKDRTILAYQIEEMKLHPGGCVTNSRIHKLHVYTLHRYNANKVIKFSKYDVQDDESNICKIETTLPRSLICVIYKADWLYLYNGQNCRSAVCLYRVDGEIESNTVSFTASY